MLKIWGRTNSVNVQKALAALEEAGIAYERVDAGLAYGVVNTPEYRALNPNGLVPTIDDDGFILWESNSIIRYVCAKVCAAPLARRSADSRGGGTLDGLAADNAARSGERDLSSARAQDGDSRSASIEKARVECLRNFAILDELLSRQPFITGGSFGIADCCLAPLTHRWMHLPVERLSTPHLEEWYSRMRQRPCGKILELPLS